MKSSILVSGVQNITFESSLLLFSARKNPSGQIRCILFTQLLSYSFSLFFFSLPRMGTHYPNPCQINGNRPKWHLQPCARWFFVFWDRTTQSAVFWGSNSLGGHTRRSGLEPKLRVSIYKLCCTSAYQCTFLEWGGLSARRASRELWKKERSIALLALIGDEDLFWGRGTRRRPYLGGIHRVIFFLILVLHNNSSV